MKVYIRDKRANPRVIYIDGHKYFFGGNKEFMNEFSSTAVKLLQQKEYLDIRLVEDESGEAPMPPESPEREEEFVSEEGGDVVEAPVEEKEEAQAPVEAPKEEKQESVIEEQVDNVQEETPVEEQHEDEHKEKSQEQPEEASVEEKPDYSAMSKKELKAVVEEKGGDPTGMTKANLLAWLAENA